MSKKDKAQAEQSPLIDADTGTMPHPGQNVDDEHLLASTEDMLELKSEVETLTQSLSEAQQKAEENYERLLRKEAELQNALRRGQDDQDKARKFAIEKFAESLLDVVDGLERGVECCAGENVSIKDVAEGLTLSQKAFVDCLSSYGIQEINPMGEAFNPSFHEALTMQESSEHAPNTVMTVIQKGYTIHDRLLRPARVVVAKAPKGE